MNVEESICEKLHQIAPDLVHRDRKHVRGQSPTFPLEQVEEELRRIFGISKLHIEIEHAQWRYAEQLETGLGSDVLRLPLVCAPLEPLCYWYMGSEESSKLLTALLGNKEAAAALEPSMREGLLTYTALELFAILEELDYPDPELSWQLAEEGASTDKAALTFDVVIVIGRRKVRGRMIFPDSFCYAWRSRIAQTKAESLSVEECRSLSLITRVEVGETHLTLQEWQSARVGDLLLLDVWREERVLLTVEGQPILEGRRTQDGIEITQRPLSYEEVSNMEEEERDDHLPSEEEGEEEEILSYSEEDEEEDWPEEEELSSTSHEDIGEFEPSVSPSEIPLTVKVEVAQVRMTADRLLSLRPGNLIELSRSLEEGVDLVVNGRRIGRGELIQVGEVLGIRLLEIGGNG